ncbi:MAG: hypothetical protein RL375_1900 [Pseudomonadota bacterium]|jgi:predicted phage tail protein
MTAAAMQRLVEVRLHGHLAAQFGRVHQLAVESAAEAVQALCMMRKGFADAVRGFGGPGYRVRVGSGDRARWLDEGTLPMRLGSAERVDIVPVTHGRKRAGVGQTIAGVILLVIYYFYPVPALYNMGVALILGGAISLLSPVAKGGDGKAKQEASQTLNGPPNITSAGGPVPLIIGRMLVGSVTISAGLSTDQVEIPVVDPGPPPLPPEEPAYWDLAPGGGGDGP